MSSLPIAKRTNTPMTRRLLSWAGLRLALGGFIVLWAAPVVWMYSTAFKPEGQVLKYPPEWLPRTVTWENFQIVIDNFPILRWYLNDLIIACSATILVLVTGSLAGYGF